MNENTMTQNINNRLDQYTYMKQTHPTCYHGLQSQVFSEGVLELYQEDKYMAAALPIYGVNTTPVLRIRTQVSPAT